MSKIGLQKAARIKAIHAACRKLGIDTDTRRDLQMEITRALQRLAADEGEFDFDARRDEARDLDVAALGEEHVVHQRREVGLVDLRSLLHRARGQADLAALDAAAIGEFEAHPLALVA